MSGIDFNKLIEKKQAAVAKDGGSFVNILNRDIKLFGSKISDKKKEEFYLELNILLTAGIDIKTTLELVANEQIKESDRTLINQIKNDIISGNTLSEAIKASNQFTAYEYYSLQIGEESGKINVVLKELATFYQKKNKTETAGCKCTDLSGYCSVGIVWRSSFYDEFYCANVC